MGYLVLQGVTMKKHTTYWIKHFRQNKEFGHLRFKLLKDKEHGGNPPFDIDESLIDEVGLDDFVKFEENRIPFFVGTQHGIYPRIDEIPNFYSEDKIIGILGKSLLSGHIGGLSIHKCVGKERIEIVRFENEVWVDYSKYQGIDNLIVYGELYNGFIVFMDTKKAVLHAKIKKAINECLDTGITWGKFRDKHSEVFEAIKDHMNWDSYNFKEWCEDVKGAGLTPDEAKEDYRDQWEYYIWMPLMEWEFKLDNELYDSIKHFVRCVPRKNGEDILPYEIINKYGNYEITLHNGELLRFKKEDEDGIIAELKDRGYVCVRDDDLICDAC